ncbi:MAG: Uma2 family endonuclease [Lawsonibacter sp.]|nr:Uma2 family endonuclease [Lawsonibacter sp.]
MNSNLAYQEEFREELIGGKAVAMSPRPMYNHNHIAFNIAVLFSNYLRGKPCTAIPDGTDLYLTEEDRFVPDVMVVCDRDKIRRDGVHGAPDLVVEVLSPSTMRNDRMGKKEVYQACGVREYWLVDPENRTIEQYLLQDGKLELNMVYASCRDDELERMSEQEKAELETHFQCSLYSDFDIALEDIFSGLLP